MTPGRLTDLARALALVRPISRRRLYWTARAVLVSDPTQVAAFDRVFRAVFGDRRSDESFDLDEVPTVAVAAPPDGQPRAEHRTVSGETGATPAPAPWSGEGDDHGPEVEVPVAMASDEERLAGKSFDALEPFELAQLYRLMTRLQLATPRRRTRRYEKGRHGQHVDLRRTLRAQPAHRRRPDPPRAPPAPRRPPPARDAVRHLGLDGALCPRLPAVPDLRRRQRAERRGVRVRHAADPPDPRAGLAPPRARHPARRGRRAGLVERDPDRRRAEDVQRPPRPARHGPRRRRRDPLRRLGARRPGARRAARWRAWPGSRTGSCGSTRA